MIENPNEFIADFAEAGANWVSVHYEACTHLHRSLELIAHHGMKPGVVLNPATRVDLIRDILPMVHHVLIMSVNPGFGGQEFIPFSLDKIRYLAELRRELGLAFRIEVDGGVAHDTVAQIVQAGADLLVAGNAVFGAGQPEQRCAGFAGCGPRGSRRVLGGERVGFSGMSYSNDVEGRVRAAAAMRWYESVFKQVCSSGAGGSGLCRGLSPSQGKETQAQEEGRTWPPIRWPTWPPSSPTRNSTTRP